VSLKWVDPNNRATLRKSGTWGPVDIGRAPGSSPGVSLPGPPPVSQRALTRCAQMPELNTPNLVCRGSCRLEGARNPAILLTMGEVG